MAIAPMEAVPDGEYPLRAITVTEYTRIIETGIFDDGERVELLDGRLIVSPPIGPLHAGLVRRLIAFFARRCIDRAIFDSNGALTLGQLSQPQPDFVLVAPESDVLDRHLEPRDALLVVEVAASSLRLDRGVKLRAYARAGVSEYWIVNATAQQIEVYRAPVADGYTSQRVVAHGESIAPVAFPDAALGVDQLFAQPAEPR